MIKRKRVFIAHRFDEEDIRYAIEEAMNQLEEIAYFADQEVSGQWILYKLSDRIRGADVVIADISVPNPNIYFEIGMAIGYNRPVLLVANTEGEVPDLFKGFVKFFFSSTSELRKELVDKLPAWFDTIEQSRKVEFSRRETGSETDWCYFGGILCDYRNRYQPEQRYLILDQVSVADPKGYSQSLPDPDLRDCIPRNLEALQDKPIFLDEVESQPTKPYELCKHCMEVRRSSFVMANLASRTEFGVYILAGLSFALLPYQMFWMIRQRTDRGVFQIPAIIRGIDFFEYKSLQDLRRYLPVRLKAFLESIELVPLDVELSTYLEQNKYLAPEIEQKGWHPEDLFRRGRLLFFLGDISRALPLFQTVSTIEPGGMVAGWVTSAALCTASIEAARRGLHDYQELGADEPDHIHYVEIYEAWLATLTHSNSRWQPLVDEFLKDEVVWALQGPAHVHFELALGLASTGYKLLALRALQRIGAYRMQEHYWWGLASMHPFRSLYADAELGPKFEKWFNHHHPRFLPDLKPLYRVIEEWRSSMRKT